MVKINIDEINRRMETVKMSQDDFSRICFNVDVDKLKFWEENEYSVLDLTTDELSHFLKFAKRWSDILKMKVF